MRAKSYAYWFMLPFTVIFTVFVIMPVVISIYYSFTSFDVLQPPRFIFLENYKQLFVQDEVFYIAFKNTLLFAMITGPLSYILSFLVAWVINEFSRWIRAVLTMVFYAPSLVNVFSVWKYIFSGDSYGVLNAYLLKLEMIQTPINWLSNPNYMFTIVIIVMLWSSFSTSFLTFIAGLQGMDTTLYEAAAVDGVHNRFQELWFITLPAMKEQLMFGAVMNIAGSFGIGALCSNLVGFPSTGYATHTIMNHLEDYGLIRYQMGYACAIAVVLFFLMVTMNAFTQKIISKLGK